ncbi:DUF3450 domain-containing protein [Methylocaldum gracile]|jgi:hypothetical protein|uniref:DUF3450 domain-containing protein n=1 Tax=Methylocaldum sp. 0917 TaxID=2485163 RepID=UPI001062041D
MFQRSGREVFPLLGFETPVISCGDYKPGIGSPKVFPRRNVLPAIAGCLLAIASSLTPAAPTQPLNGPGASPSEPPASPDAAEAKLQTLSELDQRLNGILSDAVSALKQGIENGPPFLLEERRDRLDRLEKLIRDPAASAAEKYRRVQEAYRVELDYARSVEAYRAVLRTGNDERLVDFLSIGRLALYYQTLDGHESGIWRNDLRRWQRLSGEENEAIARGLRTARKLEPPQLMVLPLPGPKSP